MSGCSVIAAMVPEPRRAAESRPMRGAASSCVHEHKRGSAFHARRALPPRCVHEHKRQSGGAEPDVLRNTRRALSVPLWHSAHQRRSARLERGPPCVRTPRSRPRSAQARAPKGRPCRNAATADPAGGTAWCGAPQLLVSPRPLPSGGVGGSGVRPERPQLRPPRPVPHPRRGRRGADREAAPKALAFMNTWRKPAALLRAVALLELLATAAPARIVAADRLLLAPHHRARVAAVAAADRSRHRRWAAERLVDHVRARRLLVLVLQPLRLLDPLQLVGVRRLHLRVEQR